MSIRADFADMLTAAWADIPALAGVRVIATERELDDIQTPTALIRLKTLARASYAPQSHRDVGVLLTLISPHIDADRAADELDDLTAAALDYLDTTCRNEGASIVGYGDRLAADIPLTLTASKE